MPTPDQIARRLARRNKKIKKTDLKKATKMPSVGGGSKAGRAKSDPSGSLRKRTKKALRSRIARKGGVKRLTASDRALAKRESININDLF